MNKVGTDILRASKYINQGELVVFPTETVYGIGADATSKEAVAKIYKAKRRPADNPLIVHVCSREMLAMVADSLTPIETKLINTFWPGPLSIIVKKKDSIANIVSAGLDTIAVRMPFHPLALAFIEACEKPIAAPSANISSRPSGTCIQDIYEELAPSVSYFIDGGKCDVGIESTVVQVIQDEIIILRPGMITKEDLLQISDKVTIDKNCLTKVEDTQVVLSPGMKHKHYAPNVACTMIRATNNEALIEAFQTILDKEEKIAILAMEEVLIKLHFPVGSIGISLGNSLQEVSKQLFSKLREIDSHDVDICYVQGFNMQGLGVGLMNRLMRACCYHIKEV